MRSGGKGVVLLAMLLPGVLLGMLPSTGLASEPAVPPTALDLVPPDEIRPDDSQEEILYRQLDLWHYRRNEGRYEDILQRLWLADSPYYCAGLARLGNNLRLELRPGEAVAWYRRAVQECSGTGWALLALAEIAQSDESLCRQAKNALGEDRMALEERRLPFAAAEGRWTREELEYLGLVAAQLVRRVCGEDSLDRRELRAMTDFRARVSFDRDAMTMEPYVESMMRADLSLRAGRLPQARGDLREAVRRACRPRDGVRAMVEAVPREIGAPVAFHLNLGAVGLLQALWDQEMLGMLEPGSQRCLQEMLHGVRREYRSLTEHPEIREWYADLDRQLRREMD